MMYAITYVYLLTDFLSIAKAHGVTRIFLNSVWLKEKSSDIGSAYYRWTDVHELSYMGAFGIGYKMLIDGKTEDAKTQDNGILITNAGLLRMHVEASKVRAGKTGLWEWIVYPGILVGTDVHRHARISWENFMQGKMPTERAVCDRTHSKPERS
jgi:hypothetical protein